MHNQRPTTIGLIYFPRKNTLDYSLLKVLLSGLKSQVEG